MFGTSNGGLQLWHSWPCPYCKRVRAALAEKGIPYRSRLVEPGEKPAELLGLESRGMVPVLVDDGRVIVESWTILEHLEERWPEPRLFPDPPGRDAVKAAYDRLNLLLAPQLPRILRGTPEERTDALHELRRAFIELDIAASDTGYLLGPFTASRPGGSGKRRGSGQRSSRCSRMAHDSTITRSPSTSTGTMPRPSTPSSSVGFSPGSMRRDR